MTAPRTVVLDTEAVSALGRGAAGMAERLEAARRLDARVVIPSITLAELMAGRAQDAAVWRVVRRFPVVDIETRIAALAGSLREQALRGRRKKRDLAVDAVVAAVAVRMAPSVVITADPQDFALLLAGHDARVDALS